MNISHEDLIKEYEKYGQELIKMSYHDVDFFSFFKKMINHFGNENVVLYKIAWQRIIESINIIELFNFSELSIINEIEKTNDVTAKKKIMETSIEHAKNYLNKIIEFENQYFEFTDDIGEYIKTITDITFRNILDYSITHTSEFVGFDTNLSMIKSELKIYIDHLELYLNNLKLYFDKNIESEKETEKDQFVNKIQIIGKKIDVVRIFESMKEAKIISSKIGEIKKYEQIFDSEEFVSYYYSTVKRLKTDQSKSSSYDLVSFIKILLEQSFKGKNNQLEEIEKFINKLYQNIS